MIGRRGEVLAGLMMVSTLLLAVEANIAKTDAALAASAAAALGALVHQLLGTPRRWVALVFWLAFASAILLKGPIVPVIVIATLCWIWAFHGRPAITRLHPLPGLALTLVLVIPWLVAIWQVSDGVILSFEFLNFTVEPVEGGALRRMFGTVFVIMIFIWGLFAEALPLGS